MQMLHMVKRTTIAIILLVAITAVATCDIEDGVDYLGADFIAVPKVESAQACAQICGSQAQCQSWTWIKDPNHAGFKKCHLKDAFKPNRQTDNCCVSGLPCTLGNQQACPSGYNHGGTCTQPGTCCTALHTATCGEACARMACDQLSGHFEATSDTGPYTCRLDGVPPRPVECTIEGNVDFPHTTDLFFFRNFRSAEDCSLACGFVEDCETWTYVKDSSHSFFRNCVLKSHLPVSGARVQSTCCDSGLKCRSTSIAYNCGFGFSPNWDSERAEMQQGISARVLYEESGPGLKLSEVECRAKCEERGAVAYNWRFRDGLNACRCYTPEARKFTPTGSGWKFCSRVGNPDPPSTVAVGGATFVQGQELKFTWQSRGQVVAVERIAIHFANDVNGLAAPVGSAMWMNTCGSQTCDNPVSSGSVIIGERTVADNVQTWPLAPGAYKAVLLTDNLRIKARSEEFTVLADHKVFQSHGTFDKDAADVSIVPSVVSGVSCGELGMQHVASKDACQVACTKHTSSFTARSSNDAPGCSYVLAGAEQGSCFWNTNAKALAVGPASDIRAVCAVERVAAAQSLPAQPAAAQPAAAQAPTTQPPVALPTEYLVVKTGNCDSNNAQFITDQTECEDAAKKVNVVHGNSGPSGNRQKFCGTWGGLNFLHFNTQATGSLHGHPILQNAGSDASGESRPTWQICKREAAAPSGECRTYLYEHFNFGGDSKLYTTGDYERVWSNDVVSSIKVIGDGCKAIVYQHFNFEGWSVELPAIPGSYNYDVLRSMGFKNDEMSSLKVIQVPSNGPSTSAQSAQPTQYLVVKMGNCETNNAQFIKDQTECEEAGRKLNMRNPNSGPSGNRQKFCGTWGGMTFLHFNAQETGSLHGHPILQNAGSDASLEARPTWQICKREPQAVSGSGASNPAHLLRNAAIVLAPSENTKCPEHGFFEIATEADCRNACLLDNRQFKQVAWNHSPGCSLMLDKPEECNWNTVTSITHVDVNNRAVCVDSLGAVHEAAKCRKGSEHSCCGKPNEITCVQGYVLQRPLSSTCDSALCGATFCANANGGSYRCVRSEFAWQPKVVGAISCGNYRTYQGKVGLKRCQELCQLDPFCKSIFGALDAGDGSCWTCPKYAPRAARRLGDGEETKDDISSLATDYKAMEFKHESNWGFQAMRGVAECPEGFEDLNEKECRAVASAIIGGTGTRDIKKDDSASRGCTLPVSPANGDEAAPTFSTSSTRSASQDTRIVCKYIIPTDGLVSLDHTNVKPNSVLVGSTGSNNPQGLQKGNRCVDGDLTSFCISRTTGQSRGFVQFELDQKIVVMRLWIANRGDVDIEKLGRFDVLVHNGISWVICARRQKVDLRSQWNEVYCEEAIYGMQIKIQHAEGTKSDAFHIADVRVQGVTQCTATVQNPTYSKFDGMSACGDDSIFTTEVCTGGSVALCREDAEQMCNAKGLNCWGYAIGINDALNEIQFKVYDARAVDEFKCSGPAGLQPSQKWDTYKRKHKQIGDVIVFKRPCWTYDVAKDIFTPDGCVPTQFAKAKGLVERFKRSRACRGPQMTGSKREKCMTKEAFRKTIGPEMFEVFEQQQLTTMAKCPGMPETRSSRRLAVRELEEKILADLATQSADEILAPGAADERSWENEAIGKIRRRLLSESQKCRRKAQVTNSAACDGLKRAAEKTVGLYQDQVALAAARSGIAHGGNDNQNNKSKLKSGKTQGAIADAVSGSLDGVSDFAGLVDNKIQAGSGSGKSALAAGLFGLAGDAVLLGADIQNAAAEERFAREEIRQLQQEADIAAMEDLSDMVQVCDQHSTDDLLCSLKEFDERIGVHFNRVMRASTNNHIRLMEELEDQEQVLQRQSLTTATILNSVQSTLKKAQLLQLLDTQKSELDDVAFARTQYGLFVDPATRVNSLKTKAHTTVEWCGFVNRMGSFEFLKNIVTWATSDAFLASTEPHPDRRPEEQGVITKCDLKKWIADYTDAHRSLQVLYTFAASIRRYKLQYAEVPEVESHRLAMSTTYRERLKELRAKQSATAIRCVGDDYVCASGFHKTHGADKHSSTRDLGFEPVTRNPCEKDKCTCRNGRGTQEDCSKPEGGECTSCLDGYLLENQKCRKEQPKCTNGTPITEVGKIKGHDKNELCAVCSHGFHLEARVVNGRHFDVCVENECYCEHGSGRQGPRCPEHNPSGTPGDANHCDSCTFGKVDVSFQATNYIEMHCMKNLGFLLFKENDFHGDAFFVNGFWQAQGLLQRIKSMVVFPGFCLSYKSPNQGWGHYCNCGDDETHPAARTAIGFDFVPGTLKEITRHRCTDQAVQWVNPKSSTGVFMTSDTPDVRNAVQLRTSVSSEQAKKTAVLL